MTKAAIESLTLSHFRSHRASRLRLDGRPVVLFGANGAGKTNVLEAVSLLSPGRGLRRAAVAEMARRPEALGWKVTATVRAGGRIREIETRTEPDQPRSVMIDAKPARQAALGHILRMLWLTPAMDRLWIEGGEGRRRFLDRMTLSFLPDHGVVALDYDKAMRERNRLLRAHVRDARWYEALETQMARSGAQIAANRRTALTRITEAMAQAQTAFPAAALSLTGPEGCGAMPEARDALAAALAEGRARDMAAGRTLSGPHRADLAAVYAEKDMAAAQCSTGEQKALLVSLVLANARALRAETGAAPVLLLDEVAAHLDSGRRAALYDEVVALGAQAWLTGTGEELFADLGARAQAFGVHEEAGLSRVEERELP